MYIFHMYRNLGSTIWNTIIQKISLHKNPEKTYKTLKNNIKLINKTLHMKVHTIYNLI